MYISIDMGGTNTRVALSENLKDILQIKRFSSNPDLKKQKILLNQAINELAGDNQIKGIAFGLPGILDKEKNILVASPNYHSLDGVAVPEIFDKNLKFGKLLIENDAAIGALGEAALGAGAESKVVAYITLGTGVGMVRVIDKKLDPNLKIFEFSHQVINFDAEYKDGYGIAGSLESYLSAHGFKKRFDQDPFRCRDEKVWEEYGRYLATGIINITLAWCPDIVIIGGGTSEKFDLFEPGITEELKKYKSIKLPRVVRSAFGQGSGVVGGFVLLSKDAN